MCGCEPGFVCSRCAGDPKQDWRIQWEDDPAEEDDDAYRRVERETYVDGLKKGAA